MQKVLSATLFPTGTTTPDGAYCEWAWMDCMEMTEGEIFVGDLIGFVEDSLEDLKAWTGEGCEIMDEIPGAIHNLPNDAVIVGLNDRPVVIFWCSED